MPNYPDAPALPILALPVSSTLARLAQRTSCGYLRGTTINVIEPDDIVLTEVASRLYLDELQQN